MAGTEVRQAVSVKSSGSFSVSKKASRGLCIHFVADEWKEHISQASLEKRKYPEDYNKPTDIKGACPLFTETVLSHHEDIPNDNADKHQLNGTALDRKDLATEKSVLEEFAKSALFSEWTSELLPPALNLKTSKPPEKSLQTLFLAVGIPPFVLVMYEPDSSGQEEESARNYASEIARVLTRSLLNYCHCEFILLACALPRDKFSEDLLSKEVEERRQQTSKIYYRRQRLNRSEYLKLKEAVTIVSRVSPVNQHLAGTQSGAGSDKTSQTLVILDQAWYNLVLYFVKIMDESLGKTKEDSQGFNFTRDCPPNVISKAKAAAKEAGRRLGLNVQTTEDKDLQHLKVRVEKPLEQK
ncbi:uncharacterized protein [Littorina saxatilis]|uniref:uncharacterized protein n=1 Tax=Littorina saxatilis TaxID=31220 RepID=UPI0038B5E1E4